MPVGPDSTYVQQYPDGHIAWVKRPGDDLGDSGAMVSRHHDISTYNYTVTNTTRDSKSTIHMCLHGSVLHCMSTAQA